MDWRVAQSILVLQKEINDAHPNRPKGSDGTIGDTRHQSQGSASDHNPNSAGVVTAWDITTADFTDALAEQLRILGSEGDARVKYVIYKNRITSAQHGWQWGSYDGSDPHTSHIHLSVSADARYYDSTAPWELDGPSAAPSSPAGASNGGSGTTTPSWYSRLLRLSQPLMHGNDVIHVQQRVGVMADGLYGDNTTAYVKTFQSKHNLTADGIVGPQTAKAIG